MTFRRTLARLVALLRQRQLDEELDDELQAHLEMAERDAIATGLCPQEARAEARRRLGGIVQIQEEHRDRRSARWMENMVRDFRYGLGALARDPGFAVIAAGVLALGIGANVAMFTLVDAVLLKPLPYPEPERIVRISEQPRPGATNSTSTLDFLDWKQMATAFEAFAAEAPVSMSLTGAGEPVRLRGKIVTAEYFKVFGARPQLGRTFRAEEEQPGGVPVIVLSHGAWQTYFGGDAGILSRTVTLDGETHAIAGVLPPGVFDRDLAQFWKLLVFAPDQYLHDFHWLEVYGRVREGITLMQARAEMQSIDAVMADRVPVWKRDWTIGVEPLSRLLVGDNLRQSLITAVGAVVVVLLIACANVANLLLAKGTVRRKEMAIRTALGASRGRLLAQLLTESMALCLVGGVCGVAVAAVLVRLATQLLAQSIPYTASLSMDYRTLTFAAAVVLGVGMLAGALPSLQVSTGNVEQSLRQSSRGSSGAHHRTRRSIVVAEVALSLVLVCGALLLFRSLFNLQQIDTGVRLDNITTVAVNLPDRSYPTAGKAAAFYEAIARELKALPGVTDASLSTHLPLRWIGDGEAILVTGVKAPVNVRFKRVDPGYFHTFGIELLAGRGIEPQDAAGARRVIVINEALASRLKDVAGLANPIGHIVRLLCPRYIKKGVDTEEVEIAGIIRSERVAGPGSPDPPVVYVPLAQVPSEGVELIVRTSDGREAIAAGIREAVRRVDPNLPVGEVATMMAVRERTLSGASRPAWLIGGFALAAALLAATGLYGVLAQAVTQQRREIGIRMALGARPRAVVWEVLRNALVLIATGLLLGTVGTVAVTRVMTSLLYKVSPLDPLSLAVACVLMALLGICAGLLPASRAAHVNPVTTLREEG